MASTYRTTPSRIALKIILLVGDASPRQDEYDGTFYEYGADRSAARVIPLVLLTTAAPLRALCDEDGEQTTSERVARRAINLARASSYEVRLFLARRLDHLWAETLHRTWSLSSRGRLADRHRGLFRDCLRGAAGCRKPGIVRVPTLDEPFNDAIADAAADSIIVSRLDGAIRALAPAAMASICVSTQARELLHVPPRRAAARAARK